MANLTFAYAIDKNATYVVPMDAQYIRYVYHQISTEPESISTKIEQASIEIVYGKYLNTLAGEPVAIFYQLSPCGYAILDHISGKVLEYSIENNHPYYVNRNEQYYYDGVLRYFSLEQDGFLNLLTGEVITVNERTVNNTDDFYANTNSQSENRAIGTEESSTGRQLDYGTRLYNCNNENNFLVFYPDGSSMDFAGWPGVCGSLACATVVAYFDDHHSHLAGSGDFAINSKKTSGSRSNSTYGIELVAEMVNYIEPSANGSIFLGGGMRDYLDAHGIEGSLSLKIDIYNHTKTQVEAGYPVIVGTTRHYSTGIGYKNYNGRFIKVDYGDGSYSWLNLDTLISVWVMNLE